MIEKLIALHQEVLSTTPAERPRYLLDQINWKAQALCLIGGRGVGKTTLMCQYLALDNIEIGIGKKIPLYLFGLLY